MLSRNVITAAALTALIGHIPAAAAREYAAEPMEATVINAETRQPVGGALVIARWIVKGDGGLHAPRDLGSVEVLETLTDEKGRFTFPGWGPKSYPGNGALLDDDPLLLVFKRGYYVGRLSNSQGRVPPTKDFRSRKNGTVRASLWNGQAVELKPFAEDGMALATSGYNRFVVSDLWPMFAGATPCDWKRLPRTVAYLDAEKKAFVDRGIEADRIVSIRDRLVANDSFFLGKGCGSPRAYFTAGS